MEIADRQREAPRSETVLAAIRAHRCDLEAMGVKSVALFGSVAHGVAHAGSDVDIAVEIEPGRVPASGFAYIALLDTIGELLARIAGRPVDVRLLGDRRVAREGALARAF